MAKKKSKKSMSKGKKSAGMSKSMPSAKAMKMEPMMRRRMGMNMWGHHSFAKLASMAFILFLITVWPAAMQLVHRIHWGWFLGATVLFMVLHWSMCKKV